MKTSRNWDDPVEEPLLPLQKLTVPRLELSGAVILTKIASSAAKDLDISTNEVYLWTDSTIVLAWLRKHPSTLKSYVSHRVSAILELLPSTIWRHIAIQKIIVPRTVSEGAQNFWSQKKLSRNCSVCQRAYRQPQRQLMGELPANRVDISLLFTAVGVDMAGVTVNTVARKFCRSGGKIY